MARSTIRQQRLGNPNAVLAALEAQGQAPSVAPAVANTCLAGLRVLVVEDEMLVSLLIKDLLADASCIVVGPFSQVAEALVAARTEPIDLAVLDVNVAGVKVYPVAELLSACQIPFLLLSGYGNQALPSDRPEWRVCSKPFRPELLAGLVAKR